MSEQSKTVHGDIRPICSHGKDHDHPVVVGKDTWKQGDELWVWCRYCPDHSNEDESIFCRFVNTECKQCHQCYKPIPPDDGPQMGLRMCGAECDAAWDAEHPGYWQPIQDTLPGGRYDGIWEDSGFTLSTVAPKAKCEHSGEYYVLEDGSARCADCGEPT